MQTDYQTALDFISQNDKTLGRYIKKVGPCTLTTSRNQNPFSSLLTAIVYQQLHAKAAETILNRFLALYPGKRFPAPEDVLKTNEKKMLAAGLSRSKMLSIKDLALKTKEGVVPSLRQIKKMSNEEIQIRLTSIRGIGRWTVDMFLIFKLGRLDVVAATDYGVRQGFKLVYKLEELPTPEQIEEKSKKWQPYASLASWYFWRVLELK